MRKRAILIGVIAILALPPPALSRPNAPSLATPVDGQVVSTFGPTLEWNDPPGGGVTQTHLQVVPYNNDGPGVDLILSMPESKLSLPAPPNWYGLLPAMSYSWRVQVSDATVSVNVDDPSWSDWSAQWTFRTPPIGPESISLVEPAVNTAVVSLTPTLVWGDSNPNAWYYEVQVSRDPSFGPGAFLYWELRHGGVTSPPRSYAIPGQFPLEAGQRYFWRVRPRVQGDGAPPPWTAPSTFLTPGGGAVDGQVTAILDGATIEVILGGQRKQVRYLGVSAPRISPAECYGAQAAARNSELVEGQIVRLEKDQTETDSAGRLLRYVFIKDLMVNAELLAQGLARADIQAPDVKYESILRAREAEAQTARRGLWAACG